jgi:hypothetical protein
MAEVAVSTMAAPEEAVHQEPEVELVARRTTHWVATAQQMELVVQHQTGAAVAVAAQQLPVQLQEAQAAMAVQVVHLRSQEQASRSLAVVAVAVATAVNQATPLPRVVTVEQVAAVTVVHRHGTDPVAVQALASVAPSTQVVAAVAVAIALAPRSLEATTAVAAAVDPESLSCAISSLPLRPPISIADQTLVRHQPTTSQETKPSRLQAMRLSLQAFNCLSQRQVLHQTQMELREHGPTLVQPVPPTPHPVRGCAAQLRLHLVSIKFVQRRQQHWTESLISKPRALP